jgi:hypothetical protein
VVPLRQAGSVTVITYPPSGNRGLAFSPTVARVPVCGSVYHGQAVPTAPSFRMTARAAVPRYTSISCAISDELALSV